MCKISCLWIYGGSAYVVQTGGYMRKLLLIVCVLGVVGCQSMYYGAMEKIGYHKRDIMSARVEKARDSQQDAKEQFKTALERFEELVAFDGGELQERYQVLNAELEECEADAQAVKDRIAGVENVGDALFDEWEDELDQFSNARLRQSSERKLNATRREYERLVDTMRRAESRIEPVLGAFRDQVLYLKHNLNARAVSALQDETFRIEGDVARLVAEMEQSIAEADRFIATLDA